MRRPCQPLLCLLAAGLLLVAGAAAAQPAEERYKRIVALASESPEQALEQAEAWQRSLAADATSAERARSQRALASAARLAGRYDRAALALTAALLANGNHEPALTPLLQSELGITYALAGLHSEALEPLRAALDHFVAVGDWRRASAMLGNIGNVLSGGGDDSAAYEHYRRALAMKREHGIDAGVAGLLNNLADNDLDNGRPAEADALLREAIAVAQAQQEKGTEAVARSNRVQALAELGEFAAAEAELAAFDALPVAEQPRLRAARDEAHARLLLAVGRAADAAERGWRLQQAAERLQRALALAASIDEPRRRERLQRLGSEIAEERGEWREALDRLAQAEEARLDGERRLQSDRQAVLAARYDEARRERELAELREREAAQGATVERQRLLLLLAATIALAGLALALLLWRRIAVRRRMERRLHTHNHALGLALDQAEQQRRHAEHLADAHTRLLQLAGDDLRVPLLQMRSAAERLLVRQNADAELSRQLASIADTAGSLLRVSEQMIETGAAALRGGGAALTVDVIELSRQVLAEVAARQRGRDIDTEVIGQQACRARVDGARLQLVLEELVQRAWPSAGGRLAIAVEHRPGQVIWALDDHGGRLSQRIRSAGEGDEAGEATLGLLWIRRAVEALGGEWGFDGPPLHSQHRLQLRLPGET